MELRKQIGVLTTGEESLPVTAPFPGRFPLPIIVSTEDQVDTCDVSTRRLRGDPGN